STDLFGRSKRSQHMPIKPPDLDQRRYQELFEESLKRIQVRSPEWSNYNQSDPGVDLVQLFAWLSDDLSYRLDSIRESDRVKFRKIAARVRRRRCRAGVLILGGSKKSKSTTARFIAAKLDLNLNHVDLTAAVKKYIGETEKNLASIFDDA